MDNDIVKQSQRLLEAKQRQHAEQQALIRAINRKLNTRRFKLWTKPLRQILTIGCPITG